MLSIKAGVKIYERLVELCHGQITPETINSLTDEDIKSIGTSSSKVSYISSVTNKILSGELNLKNSKIYLTKKYSRNYWLYVE